MSFPAQCEPQWSIRRISRKRTCLLLLTSVLLGSLGHGNRINAQVCASAKTDADGPAWKSQSGNSAAVQCQQCHPTEQLFSHPIDVVPSMKVPAELPLINGRMTCTTCHNDNLSDHSTAAKEKDALLRKPDISGIFCMNCHTADGINRENGHVLAIGKAHLTWPDRSALDRSEISPGRFDRESEKCLSCHDGLMSREVAVTGAISNSACQEHPIGSTMNGLHFSQDRIRIRLKPPQMVNPKIHFFDNRVGCVSCHSFYSKEPSLLVMSNARSQLCLNCHQD